MIIDQNDVHFNAFLHRRNNFLRHHQIRTIAHHHVHLALGRRHLCPQTARNFMFFDAPVGLIFTMDRQLGQGMFIDYGMFMGNLMTAARAIGLDTCPQAAFADYHGTIRELLSLPDHEIVVCGMALGYADPDAPENRLRTAREPVDGFTRFHGF